MNFRDDRRGVAVQVAVIVLFGFFVISASLYQATVVPNDTKRTEAAHNRIVERNLETLQRTVETTARTGGSVPVSVALGTNYRPRVLFVTPPPASGRLTATQSNSGPIRVENAVAVDSETADYWNNSTKTFSTQVVEYEAEYNEFEGAPRYHYEHGALVKQFDNGKELLVGTSTPLVDGQRLSLTSIDGSVDTSSSTTTTLDVRATSATTRVVRIRNETGENVVIELPTDLAQSTWEKRFEDVENANVSVAGGYARIVLDPGEYELRLAEVAVSPNATQPDGQYVTAVGATNRTVAPSETQSLTVEVRDGFNNPVSGVAVDSRATGGTIENVDSPSDESGQATVRYTPPRTAGIATVTASIDDDSTAAERVTFTISVAGVDSLSWSLAEWDAASKTGERGVVHDDGGNHDPAEVAVGYPKNGSRWDVGPNGYWAFDDSPDDATGNYSGTVVGAAPTSGVLGGNAYEFDGNDDYIGVNRSLQDPLGGTASLSVWFKTNQTGDGDVNWRQPGITGVESNGDVNDIFWGWLDGQGRIGFTVGDDSGGEVKSPSRVDDSAWHHLVLTRNATTGRLRMYLDGSLVDSSVSTTGVKTTDFSSIGRIEDTSPSPEYFPGTLDEVRVYDRDLSQSEALALYDPVDAASYRTATLNFTSDRRPDIQNITYDADGGSIHVQVIGSPGESGEERSKTVTLTGSGSESESLSWGSSHDSFAVQLNFTVTDPTQRPAVSRVEIG
ncbi:LamG-like jellyroll fold domain-containing protein [Haloferax elongans]|nr:LamG-like jellyroll fold domain-containing protein [Haloferax elongans]